MSRRASIFMVTGVLFAFWGAPAAAQCNDGNSCTYDYLVDGACFHAPIPDGSGCDLYSPCTPFAHCVSGNCDPGPPRDCDDGNPCTSDWCANASAGRCMHLPGNNGAPCDDHNACSNDDHCGSGICVGDTSCFDGNVCTFDFCNPVTGCDHPPNPVNPCDADGNLCTERPDSANWGTQNDECRDGVCIPGPAKVCDDGNICTSESCDPATGCAFNSNGTCGENPERLGYWKRLCEGPHPSGEFISQQDADCVKVSCTFETIFTAADVCDRLTANPDYDKCEQAEAQLMALLLDVCRGRVLVDDAIRSQCSENDTVGESLAEADGLLCSPLRSNKTCARAKCEAEEIVSGWGL